MASADHPHYCEALDGCNSRPHRLKASGWLDDLLERPMVGLNNVVEVFAGAMSCRSRQLAFSLQMADGLGIGPELVDCDRRRRPVPHGRQCLAQKAMCGAAVSPVRQHEVDQPAMFVDSPEQILPSSTCLHVGLIHPPGCRAMALIPIDSLLELRRIPMASTHDRGRVHLHAALLHHLGQTPIADPLFAVPANTDQDDLDQERTTRKYESSYRLGA